MRELGEEANRIITYEMIGWCPDVVGLKKPADCLRECEDCWAKALLALRIVEDGDNEHM